MLMNSPSVYIASCHFLQLFKMAMRQQKRIKRESKVKDETDGKRNGSGTFPEKTVVLSCNGTEIETASFLFLSLFRVF